MLLTESEKAKALRSAILDLVIAMINEKTGGGTKYINRRDVNYIPAAITEENYRKNLKWKKGWQISSKLRRF